MVLLQLDPFLNELTSMFERSTKLGSVWVTLKRSSLKSKVQRNKLATAGEAIEYRCLIRATDGKKTISTSWLEFYDFYHYAEYNADTAFHHLISGLLEYCFNTGAGFENLAWGIATGGEKVGPKDHQRFQASYATILKAHMTALKKRERKDKKKPAEADKREGSSKRLKKS
ncbi:Signal recognition particle 14 kDa protein [Glycine soja]|nr:Signal recognition particle 14 kDa protein [Glycine soja]